MQEVCGRRLSGFTLAQPSPLGHLAVRRGPYFQRTGSKGLHDPTESGRRVIPENAGRSCGAGIAGEVSDRAGRAGAFALYRAWDCGGRSGGTCRWSGSGTALAPGGGAQLVFAQRVGQRAVPGGRAHDATPPAAAKLSAPAHRAAECGSGMWRQLPMVCGVTVRQVCNLSGRRRRAPSLRLAGARPRQITNLSYVAPLRPIVAQMFRLPSHPGAASSNFGLRLTVRGAA